MTTNPQPTPTKATGNWQTVTCPRAECEGKQYRFKAPLGAGVTFVHHDTGDGRGHGVSYTFAAVVRAYEVEKQ